MKDGLGSSLVIGALILGISILTGSYMLKTSLDRSSEGLASVLAELQTGNEKLADLARANPAPPSPRAQPTRARRPDPTKKYTVAIGDAPKRGVDGAPVKIVEWSDFQCPFCGRAAPTLAQIEKEYGDKVQVVFKHMPLSMHPKALPAHRAAEAARRQGKFWEMHDLIFANQRAMSEAKYLEYAKQIGLDIDEFKHDVASPEVQKRIDADVAQAGTLGVSGTPSFFVNGHYISGAQPFATFKRMIDAELSQGG